MTKEEIIRKYPEEPKCPLSQQEIRKMKENWWMIEPTEGDRLLAGFSEEASEEATALAETYLDWCEQVASWQENHPNNQAREVIAWAENALDEARTGERSIREAIELVEYTIKLNPLGLAVMTDNNRQYVNSIRGELSAKLTAYAA